MNEISGTDLSRYDSFRRILAQRGAKVHAFESNLEAMEAVNLMDTAITLGDEVLSLARDSRLSVERAEALLLDLIECFVDPIAHSRQLIEIGKELRELKA
ncbi:MAG TPA: hypothetical protein VFS76_01925 [Pyrinomonadaceae bacterium]|nr:hypothetical protein [Pyrinomonadaceae bacterium]